MLFYAFLRRRIFSLEHSLVEEHHNQSLDFEDFELFLLDLDQFDGLQFLRNLFQFLLFDQQ